MKKCVLISLLGFAAALPSVAEPPVVSRVNARPREGVKLVDITYDLSASDKGAVTVSLQVSADGGATWEVPVDGTAGDIGIGVSPGAGRSMVWNAETNRGDQSMTSMRFRVLADDGVTRTAPGFSFIPDGVFQMGDASLPRTGSSNELPVHPVTVSAFHMGKTEVSYQQWRATLEWALNNGYAFEDPEFFPPFAELPGKGRGPDYPVEDLRWYDAVKWCNARSEREGLEPCYSAGAGLYRIGIHTRVVCDWTRNGYRLPTEAEWEKAARGGLQGRMFPRGNTITHNEASYYSSPYYSYEESYPYDVSTSRGIHPAWVGLELHTAVVDSLPEGVNGYGLAHTAGNVSEWCWDGYSSIYYASSPAANPRGFADEELLRVHRGGAFIWRAPFCRVSQRNSAGVSTKERTLGLRIARGSLREGEGIPPHGESATMALFTGRKFEITGFHRIPYYPPDALVILQTLAGVMHRVERSSLVPPVTWIPTGARVEGDGTERWILLPDQAVEKRMFYRVVAE